MALITGWNADSEVSVGETQAVINCAGEGGCKWANDDIDAGTFYFRIQCDTTTNFSGTPVYSAAQSQYYWPLSGYLPFGANSTITGLTGSTTYYYRLQTSTTSTGGWNSVTTPITEGTFPTTGASVPPIVDFTVSTTTGFVPLVVAITCTNTATNPVSEWDLAFGDGNTQDESMYYVSPEASLEDVSHVNAYTVAGTYTVTLTGTNADGTDTETKTNLITAVAPTVTATWTIASAVSSIDSLGYLNRTITLTDSSTWNKTGYALGGSRLWTVQKAGYQTVTSELDPFSTTITGTTSAAGDWVVSLARTANVAGVITASTSTATGAGYAFGMPYAAVNATFTASGTSGYTPLAVEFKNYRGIYGAPDVDQVTGDGISVLWNFGDGNTSSTTATIVTNTYTTQSAYTVSLTVTGSDTVSTTASEVATITDFVWVVSSGTYQNLLGSLFRDVQWSLMCNKDQTPCEAFDEFGGVDNLTTIYYRRLREFLRDTEILQTEATLAADTDGVYPLPATLIKLLRVEVGGYKVDSMDRKMADLADQSWAVTTTTGDCLGYITEPEDSLTLRLVPMLTGQTVKVIYVAAPNTPSVPNDCFTWGDLPLPNALSWVVKWGMIADLLRQEGEMNDPVRAAFAEDIYQFGVQVTKLMLYPRSA